MNNLKGLFNSFVLCWAFVLWPGLSAAQRRLQPLLPQPGQTIRWVTTEGSKEQGRLVAPLQPGSNIMVFCPGYRNCRVGFNPARLDTLEIASIRRLEMKVSDNLGNGAKKGGLLGFTLGILLDAGIETCCPGELGLAEAVALPAFVALSFAGIGAIVGHTSQVWRPVNLRQLRLR